MIDGLMQDHPLLISSLVEHGGMNHGLQPIISHRPDGTKHIYNYKQLLARSKKVAQLLTSMGIKQGERIATMAWNTDRHLELYYGISGYGAVLHCLNPRLSVEHLAYIIRHAEDRVIFVDRDFLPLLQTIKSHLSEVQEIVVLDDNGDDDDFFRKIQVYEQLLTKEASHFTWPELSENSASSLCYTSGTSGTPKGVLYSHRSTVLHTMAICGVDGYGIGSRELVYPLVPMYHANAWGIVYAACAAGAGLFLGGPHHQPEFIVQAIREEGITIAAAVPTIWKRVLHWLEEKHENTYPHLQRIIVGGSSCSQTFIDELQRLAQEVVPSWGMTETSPLGTIVYGRERQKKPEKYQSGQPAYGVKMRITDDTGQELPRDGKTLGHLQVAGPWICGEYYRQPMSETNLSRMTWLQTGDIATIDENNHMVIRDRDKDVIKSGGEWISSVDIEKAAESHPDVDVAATIGLPHPQWDERPLLLLQLYPQRHLTPERMQDYLRNQVVKWWLPDQVVIVDHIPLNANGKVAKRQLREEYRDLYIETP